MFHHIEFDKAYSGPNPPAKEPERQYYFIGKCRKLLEKEQERLGRPLTFHVTTFGCQMNARDSEKLAGILEQIGYEEASEEEADFVIYNTCTVRENANLKVYGHLGRLKHEKKSRPNMKIALCGCMMQEPEVVKKLKKSYGFVDLIFGTHNIFKLAELLAEVLENKGQFVDVWEGTEEIVEKLPVDRKYAFKSGVNIMFGCNNFCSYCIVPYVRGRERSRDPREILREMEELAADGVVEVMLLGQNVNSYGKNLPEPTNFSWLLRKAEEIEGIRRIRFMTSHPKDLSEELIQVMKESKKICRHLHLPLQSGSTRILEKMNRRYTKEQYLELAERIRSEIPGISLTTDIIVGFPGETEEDFEDTMDVVRKVRYDNAYTFIYSRRTGTPAASMDNQVAKEEVQARFFRLLPEVQRIAREQAAGLEGTVQEVLAEEINEHISGCLTGRMSNNLLVHFPGDPSRIGKFFPVRLEECRGFYYMGKAVSQDDCG